MDNVTFDRLVDAARIRQDGILKVKGHDYSGEVDRVANFKRVGGNLGITPATALAVYMHKHWDSIMTFVREGKVQSEPIVGRLDDMHNYLCFHSSSYKFNPYLLATSKQIIRRSLIPRHTSYHLHCPNSSLHTLPTALIIRIGYVLWSTYHQRNNNKKEPHSQYLL